MITANSALIQAADLAALLGEAELLIVDCRFDLADTGFGQRAYEQAHLPGAIYAHLDRNLSGPVTAQSGRHPLPSPEAFAATLARWGVTRATRIVAYDQGPGATAARLWWMLRASGHGAVSVLDGGMAAWLAAGLPVTATAPSRIPVPPAPARPFEGWLTTDELRAGLDAATMLLVDARAADRFAGRNETIDPVPGHVPGAVNAPFAGNLGPDGRFLPPAELATRWHATLGARRPAEAVMMCGSGVTACHNLLALEIAGLPGAQLYAGSYSEWIRDASRPTASGC